MRTYKIKENECSHYVCWYMCWQQHTDVYTSVPAAFSCNNFQWIKKNIPVQWRDQFPSCCHSVCASLSCYQLAIWRNIFPVVAGTRQWGGWLSSGTATCSVLALIWRGGNGDLTALPQKSDPSDGRKRDLLPRLSLHSNVCTFMHTQTCTQSQKEQSVRVHACS